MNQTRLEVIKSIATDTRSKRIIDELLREIERLQTENESLRLKVRELDKELRSYDERGG